MVSTEPFIGLEIHDVSLWEPSRVLPIVETMERRGYNALVLHQNDLLDECTQFGLTANFGLTDLRLKKVKNRVAWLAQLIDILDEFGARLFLEIKEPSCADYALGFYPGLIDEAGRLNPASDCWADLCREKTRLALDSLPGLGGLIVNLSSPESRVSLPDYLAETGLRIDMAAWFDRMIDAFHQPLAAAGMDLWVRDFSYTDGMQSDVLAAIERRGGAVGASIKITPHDYFPEFANNEAARGVSSPKIMEFEAFGEHTGWGLIPNCRVEEYRGRMDFAREIGAQGVLVRVSWEAITGANALDSLSDVNVFAAPRLFSADQDAHALVVQWLSDRFGMRTDAPVAREVADILLQSWEIPAAAYWDGAVFPRHSCLPASWREGLHSALTEGMGDRSITADMPDAGTDAFSEELRERLFTRKARAVELADRLSRRAEDLAARAPTELAALLRKSFSLAPLYARMFRLATEGAFHAARAADGDAERIASIQTDLLALAKDLRALPANPREAPHYRRMMFDPRHVEMFARSLSDLRKP